MLKIGFAWCFGYGGMWFGKWIIGSVITGKSIIVDGINQVVFRAGADAELQNSTKSFSITETIVKNVKKFLTTPVSLLLGLCLIVLTIMVIRTIVNNRLSIKSITIIAFPFLLLFIAPFVWYILIRNHSAIHCTILANKELIIAVVSLLCMLTKILVEIKNDKALLKKDSEDINLSFPIKTKQCDL